MSCLCISYNLWKCVLKHSSFCRDDGSISTPLFFMLTFCLLFQNSMNLPPDKARLLRQYDNEKKWELICDQVDTNLSYEAVCHNLCIGHPLFNAAACKTPTDYSMYVKFLLIHDFIAFLLCSPGQVGYAAG